MFKTTLWFLFLLPLACRNYPPDTLLDSGPVCGLECSTQPDAGSVQSTCMSDAGSHETQDSGSVPNDAGSGTDAGTHDAGKADSGSLEPIDGGISQDAGSLAHVDGGMASADAGSSGTDAGTNDELTIEGNHIVHEGTGTVARLRGANLHDTRSCDACSWNKPNVGEVKRRAAELISWGATFVRFDLESYATLDGRAHGLSALSDSAYLADVVSIVQYIESFPGVYVEVSLWVDPSLDASGIPTSATADTWAVVADALKGEPKVLFGVANEPTMNYDHALDAARAAQFDLVRARIRSSEGAIRHIVVVQGLGGWARLNEYWVAHPMADAKVAYEVHVYDQSQYFQDEVYTPAATLPLIIGEFGPAQGMTLTDTDALMTYAELHEIPYTAWTFHPRCPPNLLVDNSGGGCGVGMTLAPTSFGTQLKAHLHLQ